MEKDDEEDEGEGGEGWEQKNGKEMNEENEKEKEKGKGKRRYHIDGAVEEAWLRETDMVTFEIQLNTTIMGKDN